MYYDKNNQNKFDKKIFFYGSRKIKQQVKYHAIQSRCMGATGKDVPWLT